MIDDLREVIVAKGYDLADEETAERVSELLRSALPDEEDGQRMRQSFIQRRTVCVRSKKREGVPPSPNKSAASEEDERRSGGSNQCSGSVLQLANRHADNSFHSDTTGNARNLV